VFLIIQERKDLVQAHDAGIRVLIGLLASTDQDGLQARLGRAVEILLFAVADMQRFFGCEAVVFQGGVKDPPLRFGKSRATGHYNMFKPLRCAESFENFQQSRVEIRDDVKNQSALFENR
jgi:hypothetical protein